MLMRLSSRSCWRVVKIIQSGIVTIACCSIDETINTTNKRINDYSICTFCTVHTMYSPSYVTQATALKNRQPVTYYHAFHFPRNHLIASHPVSRFTAASIRTPVCQLCFCTLLYCTLSCNKSVFIHRTVCGTVSINLTWHSSECKGWHSNFFSY